MINKILILTTVLLVLLGKTNGQLLAQPPGYILTFKDNFNGTQLDLTKWSFCPEWVRQGGCYWEADNHQLTGNGALQLIVSESAGKGLSVTFLSGPNKPKRTEILSAYELVYKNKSWEKQRRLNGDETGNGFDHGI